MIRHADPADVVDVTVLDREATASRDRSSRLAAAQRDGRLLVAVRAGELVGYAVVGTFFDYDFLELLVVRSDARRTGIGTALVRAVEERTVGGKLFTSTNQSNEPMQALCRALGFEPSGIIDNLDEGDPELVFVKRL